MTDFATLVLAADTRQMTQAEKAIDGVTKSGARAETQTDKTTAAMERMDKMARRAAIGAAALVTAVVALTRSSANNIDALAKQARQVGLLTKDFQAMSLVAEEAGVSAGSLTSQIAFMQRAIVELSRGTASQTRAFGQLGLSIRDLQGLSPDQQFERIAVALSGVEDPAQKTALAMELFGRSGREAINMLDGYTDALADARRFQEAFGISVDQNASDAIERANDALERLGMGFRGLGNTLAAEVAPRLEAFANRMIDAIIQTDAINKVANVLIGLLDRIGFFAGAAALALGAYRAAAIASTIATAGLSGALAVARAAFIRLGLPALVIVAGELAFRFSRLVDGAGGFAEAMSLLADVAIEAFNKIVAGGVFLSAELRMKINDISFNWAKAVGEMGVAWGAFVDKVAQSKLGERLGIEGGNELAAIISMNTNLSELNDSLVDLQKTSNSARDIMNAPMKSIEAIRDALADTTEESESTSTAVADLTKLLDAGGGSAGLSGGANAATDAAEKLTKELDGPLSGAIDGVANAFGDFIVNGLRDFRGFTRSILDSFKQMLSQMIAMAARNRIMLAISGGGSLAGTAASAGGAGLIGSAGAGLAGIGSNLGAAATTALGLGGTFTGSFGAGLGATMTGGIAGGAGAFSTGIGMMGTAGMAGSGAAMAIGAAVPVIGAVVAGLTLLSSIGAKRAAKRLEAATNANNAKLEKVEQEHNERVAEMTARLRANVDATEALIQSMQTLAQMEQEREQAARAILAERENLEVELLRLQNDTVALREREIAATEPVNRQLRRFILAMGDAAEAIEAQRRAVEGLASAGRGVVDFVRGIRNQAALSFREDLALAQGGDIAASGRITGSAQSAIDQARAGARTGVELDRFIGQTAASLMALPAVATFEEQQVMLLEEISSGIGDLTKLQDDTQRKLIRAIDQGFFTIDSNLDGKLTFEELKRGLGGIATDAELRQIFQTLDKNGDGTISRLESLGGSNESIDDNTLFAARESLNQLSELKLIAGETKSNTQRVKELTTAIETLVFSQKVAGAQQMANLEAQRAAAERTLKNAQRAIAGTPSTVVLQSKRKGFLGIGARPEIRGANPTFVALEADIRRAQEELAALEAQMRNVPQFATGGAHMGGARIVGERGPELEVTGPSQIHNSASTMQMLSNAPVVSELKELRREFAAMRDEQRQLGIQTARNTDRGYRVLREWNVTGLPEERVE